MDVGPDLTNGQFFGQNSTETWAEVDRTWAELGRPLPKSGPGSAAQPNVDPESRKVQIRALSARFRGNLQLIKCRPGRRRPTQATYPSDAPDILPEGLRPILAIQTFGPAADGPHQRDLVESYPPDAAEAAVALWTLALRPQHRPLITECGGTELLAKAVAHYSDNAELQACDAGGETPMIAGKQTPCCSSSVSEKLSFRLPGGVALHTGLGPSLINSWRTLPQLGRFRSTLGQWPQLDRTRPELAQT